jgi:hypothetical protein
LGSEGRWRGVNRVEGKWSGVPMAIRRELRRSSFLRVIE